MGCSVIFVGDLHGWDHKPRGLVNPRKPADVTWLSQTIDALNQHTPNGAALVQLGDLFHRPAAPPSVVHAMLSSCAHARLRIALPGNHDVASLDATGFNQSNLVHTSAYDWLGPNYVARAYAPQYAGRSLIAVPFTPAADLRAVIAQAANDVSETTVPTVLALHIGVITADTPAFLRGASDAIALEELCGIAAEHGIEHVFCGNWHTPRADTYAGVTVHQLGVFAPFSHADEGLHYGRLATISADSRVRYAEVPGPRFVTAQRLSLVPAYALEFGLRVRCRGSVDVCEAFRAELELFGWPDHIFSVSFEVVPDSAGLIAAAAATSGAASLQQALSGFCAARYGADPDLRVVADTTADYIRRAG